METLLLKPRTRDRSAVPKKHWMKPDASSGRWVGPSWNPPLLVREWPLTGPPSCGRVFDVLHPLEVPINDTECAIRIGQVGNFAKIPVGVRLFSNPPGSSATY